MPEQFGFDSTRQICKENKNQEEIGYAGFHEWCCEWKKYKIPALYNKIPNEFLVLAGCLSLSFGIVDIWPKFKSMKTPLLVIMSIMLGIAVNGQELEQSQKDSLMALDFEAFDQDMDGGWRYYRDQGQFALAASLIESYLEKHQEIEGQPREVMSWHAGQMYAMDGQNEKAIPLLEASRKEDDFMMWNQYLDATVAFLKKDRMSFDKNLKAMSAIQNNPNLRLLQILEANFDLSYREALEQGMKKR